MEITNFSIYANAYRNLHRYRVIALFASKSLAKNKEEKLKIDKEARELWHRIIEIAEDLPKDPTCPFITKRNSINN